MTSKKNDGSLIVEEYNTVIFAIGRDACTQTLNLEQVGVKVNPSNGKIIADDREKSSADHIHAIGDVLDGKLELTPVAIQSGKLLARVGFLIKFKFISVLICVLIRDCTQPMKD